MKKLLACLLIATLLLGGSAIGASAVLAEPDPAIFVLPTVVAIEAQLRDDVEEIQAWDGWPDLGHWNIDLTLHFADGTSRLLRWWDGWTDDDLWWEVIWRFDAETHVVTFFYLDSDMDFDDIEEWNKFLATLPQTTLDLSDVEFVEWEWTTWQPGPWDRLVDWFFTSPWALPLRIVAAPVGALAGLVAWTFAYLLVVPLYLFAFVFGWW